MNVQTAGLVPWCIFGSICTFFAFSFQAAKKKNSQQFWGVSTPMILIAIRATAGKKKVPFEAQLHSSSRFTCVSSNNVLAGVALPVRSSVHSVRNALAALSLPSPAVVQKQRPPHRRSESETTASNRGISPWPFAEAETQLVRWLGTRGSGGFGGVRAKNRRNE